MDKNERQQALHDCLRARLALSVAGALLKVGAEPAVCERAAAFVVAIPDPNAAARSGRCWLAAGADRFLPELLSVDEARKLRDGIAAQVGRRDRRVPILLDLGAGWAALLEQELAAALSRDLAADAEAERAAARWN